MEALRYLLRTLLAIGCSMCVTGGIACAQKTIRIGAPLELSGKFVTYGEQGRRGIEMAVEAFGGSVAGQKFQRQGDKAVTLWPKARANGELKLAN